MVGMARADMSTATSAYLPTVSFTETFTNTNDPLLVFGIKLSQKSITLEDFNPDLLNNPESTTNFRTSIEVSQPLFNWDGIKGRRAAKMNFQASLHDKAWAEKVLTLQTKNLYYQLELSIKGKSVIEKAKNAAEESRQVSENLFDQGIIKKADLMGAELHATQMESSLLQADYTINLLNQQLLQLLGSEEEFMIIPTDSIQVQLDDHLSWQGLSISEDRADLKAMKYKAMAGEINLGSKKGAFVPRINAYGSYNLNDSQIFGNQADNYMVGVQLRWDLFSGSKNLGAVQRARYEKDFAEISYLEKLSESERNLIKIKNDVELAAKQVYLAKLGADQASELYRIRSDRYKEGLEKTADLIQDESNYLHKQIEWLRSQHHYLQLLFQLEAELSSDMTN